MPRVRTTADEDAARRFHASLRPLLAQDLPDELFPSWLALAVQDALGADGAGLSIIDEQHRVPIGASGESAAAAERLQFTVGEGPCLAALGAGQGVRVDEDQMRAEWSAFHSELVESSPYRSVVAVPLQLASGPAGALDVYFETPTMPAYAALSDALAVVDEVARLLDHVHAAEEQPADGDLPFWVDGPQARARFTIWLAVGVLVVGMDVTVDQALAILRAHAYARGLDIDSVTADLISGALTVDDLAAT